jgi:hypothetical protein
MRPITRAAPPTGQAVCGSNFRSALHRPSESSHNKLIFIGKLSESRRRLIPDLSRGFLIYFGPKADLSRGRAQR